jgi:hypothetical protein
MALALADLWGENSQDRPLDFAAKKLQACRSALRLKVSSGSLFYPVPDLFSGLRKLSCVALIVERDVEILDVIDGGDMKSDITAEPFANVPFVVRDPLAQGAGLAFRDIMARISPQQGPLRARPRSYYFSNGKI